MTCDVEPTVARDGRRARQCAPSGSRDAPEPVSRAALRSTAAALASGRRTPEENGIIQIPALKACVVALILMDILRDMIMKSFLLATSN